MPPPLIGKGGMMGQSLRLHREYSDGAGNNREAFDCKVAALITQLEHLLAERAHYHAGVPPDTDILSTGSARLSSLDRKPALTPGLGGISNDRAARARALINARRLRARHMPADLFAEPAWDMLLDLYAAHYEGRRVAVKSLCIAAHVPATTALRSIETMAKHGCLIRRRDTSDARRIFIALSDDTRTQLDRYFDALAD